MPYWREVAGLLIAFGIGSICALFRIPLPAPPHWLGVAMIVAIWLGYTLFNKG